MGAWKLTVRDGSDVSHQSFDELGEAVAAMREQALAIRARGPAKAVSALRDFGPEAQVRARLQLSGKGWLRKPVAGIDVRGDGTFMPYRGGSGGRSSTRPATTHPSTWCARLSNSDPWRFSSGMRMKRAKPSR